ncbi:hypothetical protein ACFSKI_11160 [Pseudogracilibacillus auburnensis]|uniref:Uncharacterized protein n=1 Tax=Pseudogracilibacillus auburnensis TaxID=1494959 RepID=A0A2V3VNE4_9BACI|nr:hypothetical protein [Pseudogracilibacillus auburnensis]MBO1001841.1 hypothetical protein [Pseudogracilibacillus auburnensis]PXW83373.1 hypothetical protein DFR56_11652 [Pseudogracilibacillus auburnensis]
MLNDLIDISYANSFDEDLYIINGFGEITSYINEEAVELDKTTHIGSIFYRFYNTYEFADDLSIVISADAISGEEEYMMYTLLKGDHGYDLDYGGKVVTLDRIIIENKYYNEELERLILKKFISYCSYLMFDYIVVIATPPITPNDSKGVIEFPQLKMYENFHFVNLGGTEKRAPVMVKNLNLKD